MKTTRSWPIGVCSWSLRNDVEVIKGVLEGQGLSHMHLDVSALAGDQGDAMRDLIKDQGVTITSGMVAFPQEDYSSLDAIRRTGGVVPDDAWEGNRQLLLDAIDATVEVGAPQLSFHAGFIDHADASYTALCDRIRCGADAAGEKGILLNMESGQESAADLAQFMNDMNHPALGINFDPANMILYDKDNPCDAVSTLGQWIKHVHIKDATRTTTPGEWGAEVPWGDGEVNTAAFLQALEAVGFSGAVAIEREAGESRAEDVGLAVQRLTS